MTSLTTKVNAQLKSELSSPLVEASPASLGTKGLFLWVLVGITGGLLVHLAFDVGSQAILQGVGIGVGILVGLTLKDRSARLDTSQPGGLYVILGATGGELLVVERSMWTMKDLGIAAKVPFDRVAAVHVENGTFTPGSTVTFSLADGQRWRYEVPKWTKLREALPTRLRGT